MARIANNVLELMGNTPMVRLNRVTGGVPGHGGGQAGVSKSGWERQGSNWDQYDQRS